MKKILLTLLIILSLCPIVNAEEAEWKLFATKTYGASNAYSAVVGDYLYVFGGKEDSSSSNSTSHKIEISTGIISNIARLDSNIEYNGVSAVVGTDIYFFGGKSAISYNTAYKYDTINNSYSQIANLPASNSYSRAVSIGTDIYIIGGQTETSSDPINTIYKYDTLTDTYTTYTPFSSYRVRKNCVAVVGTDIYILGTYLYATAKPRSYKYDTLTNTLTQIADVPEVGSGWAISRGTDIYIFPESSTTVYKYDTLTDTYETVNELTRLSARTGNSIVYGNGMIFDVCGNYEKTIYSYSLPDISYEPEIPEEPEIVADSTLDNFYSIYIDKLSSLSKFATENKFVLGAIGIVLLIAVLEIVLNLFRKGGYH